MVVHYTLREMKFALRIFVLIFLLAATTALISTKALAQAGIEGIASPLVTDEQVVDGEIISYDGESMSKSKKAFDPNIYGVAVKNPALAVMDLNNEASMYVATSGKVLVKVSAKEGAIKVNDLITSSEDPGVGVKASSEGVVLGVALESFDGSGSGYIPVNVRPHFSGDHTEGNIFKKNIVPMLLLFFLNLILFR